MWELGEILVRSTLFYLFLSGAIGMALGNGAAGAFTNSSYLWENMHKVRIKVY